LLFDMGCASIGGISETRRPLRIWESNGNPVVT
jgi:hypothetical protein